MMEAVKYCDTIIASDSRSLLQRIEMKSPGTTDIREALQSVHGHSTLWSWNPANISPERKIAVLIAGKMQPSTT